MPKSNFDFLRDQWNFLFDDAHQAERNAFIAPRTSAFYARRVLEKVADWLYTHDRSLRAPYKDNLGALIHETTFQKLLPTALYRSVKLLHRIGNQAVHSDVQLKGMDGLQLTRAVHDLTGWLVRLYTSSDQPLVIAQFQVTLLPKAEDKAAKDQTAKQLNALQQEMQSRDDAIKQANQQLADSEAEIERLLTQIAAVKKTNIDRFADIRYDTSEAETRVLYIDVLLREAGWDPQGENVPEYPVTGMPNETGEGFVDYVLWGKDGLPLAVIEAKRTGKSPEAGKQQAKLYADCIEAMHGRRPVIYYTNGYETWLWDDSFYPPREVQGFATRDELQLMINRRQSRKDIEKAPVNKTITERYYQEEAIRRVGERFQKERSRAALLVMATGTGKTRVSISTVELLMRQNWVKRVLFLADRTALVRQAKNAFTAHLPNVSTVNLVSEKEDDKSRIVFSTYHTLMNLIDDAQAEGTKRFGTNYFDLIIIDEAHRSVYQKFGAIFDYFDSLLLGLTATPRAEVDKNTYNLFNLEDHVPTYAYELDKAVADEYLRPPKAVAVPLRFPREGIKYVDLSDEEKEAYEAEENFYDEQTGQLKPEIDAAALNQWLFNKDTVNKALAFLMERGLKIEGGDKLGKTIIFAKNQKHAEFIVKQFDINYPWLAGSFCRVISHSVNYAQSLIDDFTVAKKDPFIAVSVDMLDTGIDVPEIVNLVFFKRVRSRVKFWQMIGRGTRLREDLFGPGQDKKYFYVFDFCENLAYFSANPVGIEAPAQESVKQSIFKRRLELSQDLKHKEDNKPLQALSTLLLDQLHDAVDSMNRDNFLVRPRLRYVDRYNERECWNGLGPQEAVEITRYLSGLPWPDDDEEYARRFDLLILNLQLAIVQQGTALDRYQKKVRNLAVALEEKQAIPTVAVQMPLIQDLQTDVWWQDVTLPMLEEVRRKLRELIKFLDRQGEQEQVYTDFEDEIGIADEDFELVTSSGDRTNYRLKVERFIREHEDHPSIQQLKSNRPITVADLNALETLLFSDDGPGKEHTFRDIYGTDQPLGTLVRQIIGLDRKAAKEAFADFLAENGLNADQIRFVDQIIDHLAQNGIMDPEALFNPPFSDIHHEGIAGVFPKRAPRVLGILESVLSNTVAH